MTLLLRASFHQALGPAREKWPGPLEPFSSRPQQKQGILLPFPAGALPAKSGRLAVGDTCMSSRGPRARPNAPIGTSLVDNGSLWQPSDGEQDDRR
jgi:hypothetical protein